MWERFGVFVLCPKRLGMFVLCGKGLVFLCCGVVHIVDHRQSGCSSELQIPYSPMVFLYHQTDTALMKSQTADYVVSIVLKSKGLAMAQ